jgi:hypothetical protein
MGRYRAIRISSHWVELGWVGMSGRAGSLGAMTIIFALLARSMGGVHLVEFFWCVGWHLR